MSDASSMTQGVSSHVTPKLEPNDHSPALTCAVFLLLPARGAPVRVAAHRCPYGLFSQKVTEIDAVCCTDDDFGLGCHDNHPPTMCSLDCALKYVPFYDDCEDLINVRSATFALLAPTLVVIAPSACVAWLTPGGGRSGVVRHARRRSGRRGFGIRRIGGQLLEQRNGRRRHVARPRA
eukprot:SAG11_NODE_101_length_16738_cov_8.254703_1_plen_178_part_00